MSLDTYTKTLVEDNTTRVLASHHNNQETQLEALTDHALVLADLMSQNVQFGTVGAGVNTEKTVFVAPATCKIVGLWLVNSSAVASNGVNFTKLELLNKGVSGVGSTVLATFLGSSTSFSAFIAFNAEISGTTVLAGTVLTLKKTDAGAGAAVTDLMVLVAYQPV